MCVIVLGRLTCALLTMLQIWSKLVFSTFPSFGSLMVNASIPGSEFSVTRWSSNRWPWLLTRNWKKSSGSGAEHAENMSMLLLSQDITLFIHALVHFVDYFAIMTCLLSEKTSKIHTLLLHYTHLHLCISITTLVIKGRFLKMIFFSCTERKSPLQQHLHTFNMHVSDWYNTPKNMFACFCQIY